MQINIGNLRIGLYISKLEKRTGICSKQYDSNEHCLLWDFDEADLNDIIADLSLLQDWYNLPEIILVESSKNKYHAYCFVSKTFQEVIHILSSTPNIDMSYLRLGVTKGYFTLRISKRKDGSFKLVKKLSSAFPNEINPLDLTINEYLTSNKGGKNAKR